MYFCRKYYSFVVHFIVIVTTQLVQVSRCDTGTLFDKSQSDSSWQWLTVYKFRSGIGWSREGVTGSYVVCDIASTKTNHTDSWLVSDIIQSNGAKEITISLTFTTRECPLSYPYCVTYFKILALQTDEPSSAVSEQTIIDQNFTFVGNASAKFTWTSAQSVQENVINVTQVLSKKNIYIAFQDIGSCIAIKKISVTYKFCPSVTSNGVTFNKTFAPPLHDKEASVTGSCLSHASSVSPKALLTASCLSNGDWRKDNSIVCQCDPGFEMVNEKCQRCPNGKYKAAIGNHACTLCPSHSSPSVSRDQCPCASGYYRTANEQQSDSCSAPPSAPRELKTTMASPNVIIVMWSPPKNNGGRNDLTYDVICRKCNSGLCTEKCSGVAFWPANENLTWTHVTISDVSALVSYRVTVLAKNGVSNVAGIGFHANQTLMVTIPRLNVSTIEATSPSTAVGSQVSTAIGVSVVCTFIFCLIIGLLVAWNVLNRYKNKIHLENHGDLRRYSRYRNDSTMTSMTELTTPRQDRQVSSPSIKEDNPETNIDDVTKISHDLQPISTNQEAWTNEHSINEDIPEINIDDVNDDVPDKSHDLQPIGSNQEAWTNENLKACNGKTNNSAFSSSISMRSWFPQNDVQYGI